MKALVGAFNQEKALVGAFSVIVKPVVEPMEHYTALVTCYTCDGDGKQVTGDITSHHHTEHATGGDSSTVQGL